MSGNLLILIELLLVFGVIFWFGFSQLRGLKKLRAKRDAETAASDETDR